MRAVRLFVSGRVQGVGFRYFVAGEARTLRLVGFVRNLRDGRVEAEVRGPADRVDALIVACRRGPPGSSVDQVDVIEADGRQLPDPFEIQRNG